MNIINVPGTPVLRVEAAVPCSPGACQYTLHTAGGPPGVQCVVYISIYGGIENNIDSDNFIILMIKII